MDRRSRSFHFGEYPANRLFDTDLPMPLLTVGEPTATAEALRLRTIQLAGGTNLGQEAGEFSKLLLGTGTTLLENRAVDTEVINIRVDAETARTFKSLPDEDRRKIEALLSIRLSDVSRSAESLDAIMKEIADKAKARGLNPEILKSLLDEE